MTTKQEQELLRAIRRIDRERKKWLKDEDVGFPPPEFLDAIAVVITMGKVLEGKK